MQHAPKPTHVPVPVFASKRARVEEQAKLRRRSRLSSKQPGLIPAGVAQASIVDVAQKVTCVSAEAHELRLPFGVSDDEAPLIDEAPIVDDEASTNNQMAVVPDAGQNPAAPVEGLGVARQVRVEDSPPQHGDEQVSPSVGHSGIPSPQAGSESGLSQDAGMLAAQLVAADISPRLHSIASATPGNLPAGSATPIGGAGTPSHGRIEVQPGCVARGQYADGRPHSISGAAEATGNVGRSARAEKNLRQIIKVEDSPPAIGRRVKLERRSRAVSEEKHDERDDQARGIVKTLVWLDEVEASVLQLQRKREAVMDMLHVLASLHTLEEPSKGDAAIAARAY